MEPSRPRQSLVVSPSEVSQARELILHPTPWAKRRFDLPSSKSDETQAALRELQHLVRTHGSVNEKDVEVLVRELRSDMARAMRETLATIRELKEGGAFVRLRRVDTITDEVLARLSDGRISTAEARHVEKTARVELLRMFDDPIEDDDFRVHVAYELKRRYFATNRDLDRWAVPVEIPLRERHARQANALAVVLRAFDPKTQAAGAFELSCIERIGRCGGQAVLPILYKFVEETNDPKVSKAAKTAIRSILKASRMTIVLTAMEAKPYCGTGGLSNVMGELPKALAKMGHRVIVLVPRHAAVDRSKLKPTGREGTVYGPGGAERFGLYRDRKDGVDYYFIENDRFFSKNRSGIYMGKKSDYPDHPENFIGPYGDYLDNPERFDFFGAAVPVAIRAILGSKAPDVVQINDAHCATAAVYLKEDRAFRNTRTIMAVHNLAGYSQGVIGASKLHNMRFDGLGLFTPTGPAEYYGNINLMKLGLAECDAAITVSRKYMHEVLEEDGGQGLHGVLRAMFAQGRLWGNLNGIDPEVWNPETDPLLKEHFSIADLEGKKGCKSDLQCRFELDPDPEAPLFGVVARLTKQKGFEDVVAAIEHAMAENPRAQFVVVGEGERKEYVDQLRALEKKYPGKVRFDEKFTVDKEHLIYAGCDFFLMPSRFEPCGLPQMYALRYGTVPIVRAVGGLDESIEEGRNGFKFGRGQKAGDVESVIDGALAWYGQGSRGRDPMIRRCMSCDFSWENSSAVEQVAFYRKVINQFAKGAQL